MNQPLWTAPGFKTYRPILSPRWVPWIVPAVIATLLAFGIAVAFAQQPAQPFAPIDEELWNRTREAILQQSMPFSAHQAVLNIMQQIEQQARQKAAIDKTKPAPPALGEKK